MKLKKKSNKRMTAKDIEDILTKTVAGIKCRKEIQAILKKRRPGNDS